MITIEDIRSEVTRHIEAATEYINYYGHRREALKNIYDFMSSFPPDAEASAIDHRKVNIKALKDFLDSSENYNYNMTRQLVDEGHLSKSDLVSIHRIRYQTYHEVLLAIKD